MKKHRLPLQQIRTNLLKLKQLDAAELKTYRQKFPNATAFLNSAYPRLAARAPRRLRDAAVLRHTTHHLGAAEQRLKACDRCPESGGACAGDEDGHRPGLQPAWEKGETGKIELELVECTRWAEWLSRGRVLRAGVEPRLAGVSLQDVAPRMQKKTAPLIGEFVAGCRQGTDQNLLLVGGASTEVAVAVLRSLLSTIPDLDARYVRCPHLSRPLKQHYADPQRYPHPTKELMGIDLLVMVETDIYPNVDWLDEEMRELVYTRYLHQLPTLLATEKDNPNQIANYYFKTAIPVCITP